MKSKFLAGVALGVGLAFAAPAYAQLKVGVAGPMTGGNAVFGAQLKNGAEQAVADINAAGGVLGPERRVGDDARRGRHRQGDREQAEPGDALPPDPAGEAGGTRRHGGARPRCKSRHAEGIRDGGGRGAARETAVREGCGGMPCCQLSISRRGGQRRCGADPR